MVSSRPVRPGARSTAAPRARLAAVSAVVASRWLCCSLNSSRLASSCWSNVCQEMRYAPSSRCRRLRRLPLAAAAAARSGPPWARQRAPPVAAPCLPHPPPTGLGGGPPAPRRSARGTASQRGARPCGTRGSRPLRRRRAAPASRRRASPRARRPGGGARPPCRCCPGAAPGHGRATLAGDPQTAGAPAGSVAGGSQRRGRRTGQRRAGASAGWLGGAGGGAGLPPPRAGLPAAGRCAGGLPVFLHPHGTPVSAAIGFVSVWRLVRRRR
jgi:hypothetical protein